MANRKGILPLPETLPDDHFPLIKGCNVETTQKKPQLLTYDDVIAYKRGWNHPDPSISRCLPSQLRSRFCRNHVSNLNFTLPHLHLWTSAWSGDDRRRTTAGGTSATDGTHQLATWVHPSPSPILFFRHLLQNLILIFLPPPQKTSPSPMDCWEPLEPPEFSSPASLALLLSSPSYCPCSVSGLACCLEPATTGTRQPGTTASAPIQSTNNQGEWRSFKSHRKRKTIYISEEFPFFLRMESGESSAAFKISKLFLENSIFFLPHSLLTVEKRNSGKLVLLSH